MGDQKYHRLFFENSNNHQSSVFCQFYVSLERNEDKMNSKKITTLIIIAVITSLAITACGGTQATAPTEPAPEATSAPAEKVTLTIWHNWGPDDAKGAPLQSIFADFMAANPDIIIADEVYVDADIPLKVETASVANQEPDLVFVQRVGSPITWTDSGVALPVNDYISDWGFNGLFKPSALAEYTLADGKIQAFPLEGYTWPIWYNTKIFDTAGVAIPTTTDELIAAAAAIRAAGFQPVIASGVDDMGAYLFTLIMQSAMTDDEAIQCMGQGDWSVPNCIKGVELFVQLRDAGVFVDGVEGIDYGAAEEQFGTGKVAICHYGAWAFADPAMLPLNPDVQLGGFPLPAGSPHSAPVYYSAYSAKGIWITPNGAAKIEAVKKFIQFIYQPSMMARLVEQAGMTPPLIDVPVDASMLNSLFVQSLNMPAEVAMTPDDYRPPAVGTDFSRISQEAFAPGTTAEKILADLTAAYEAIK
jgi:multiple sugar transport system substrate-binding protein